MSLVTQGTEKDEGIKVSLLSSPETTAICINEKKPGLISRASSLPPCTYPKVVEHARRLSTSVILKLVLDTLQGCPNTTGAINVSSLARVSLYSRPTVDRALAFGIRFKIIERVVLRSSCVGTHENHPGRPVRYKSLWKLTTSKRAPFLKKSFKVQALASTKTGLCPSPKLKRAAMVKLRQRLTSLGQPRLTSAYGKYVWSKAATVAGISLLVHTASAMINERTKTLPLRDAFAVVVQNINLTCRSLDATERYLATLKREALPDDIEDLFKKPTLANMSTYATGPNFPLLPNPKTPLRLHQKAERSLTHLENGSSLFVSNQKESKPGGSNEKVRVTNPECGGGESGFSLLPDGLLQRWRTLIQDLTDDDADLDDRPRLTSDDDSTRPRAGPLAAHGGAVPRPFGPRRATIRDDETTRRRRQARRRVRLTGCSDALGASAVQSTQRRDTLAPLADADH